MKLKKKKATLQLVQIYDFSQSLNISCSSISVPYFFFLFAMNRQGCIEAKALLDQLGHCMFNEQS